MRSCRTPCAVALLASALACACSRRPPPPPLPELPTSEEPRLQVDPTAACRQTIDGFGTTGPYKALGSEPWLQDLYYDDLGASILRVDLTPAFRKPYSEFLYNSPWFHESPPLPGPDDNNVRSYRDASDYAKSWGGRRAPIAVMGPDIERNVGYFDYDAPQPQSFGKLAARGTKERDFKLVGSLWSPAPWLKVSSGNRIEGHSGVLPKDGAAWPFVWNGNFSGGMLDTSGKPLAVFDDKKLGGTGPTSALTQLGRSFAAYVLGFQRRFGVRFHAISIQNELNFETFYNSCTYRRASEYIAALKEVRRAFDAHPELRDIQLMGPEDLLSADGYTLWQYGAEQTAIHKNLQYVAALAADPEARAALGFFATHAYTADGVHSSGADPQMWTWWLDGWQKAPGEGLPERVQGIRPFGRKSWMTEASGEPSRWTTPENESYVNSALGIGLKIHHALTAGEQSAWLYWQITDGEPVKETQLTDDRLREHAPKYVAVKHFFRFIRPGACRIDAALSGGRELYVSAYRHERDKTLTLVVLNGASEEQRLALTAPQLPAQLRVFSSREGTLWQESKLARDGSRYDLALAPRSLTTLIAQLE